MNSSLNKAYKIIFEKEPEGLEDWQVAEQIIERFSVRELGEELAGEVIYAIVLDIKYPNQEITARIVGRAEGFAGELWDDLPDEPHMADLERRRSLSKEKQEMEPISRR